MQFLATAQRRRIRAKLGRIIRTEWKEDKKGIIDQIMRIFEQELGIEEKAKGTAK